MNKLPIAAISAAISLAFSVSATADTMTKSEYKAAKQQIQATYTSNKASCDPFVANAKDICLLEARSKENVALAELTERNRPGRKAHYDVRIAIADGEYKVAKEKCDDMASDKTAKAKGEAHGKILDARHDAAAEKNNAEYRVAIEKCDALSGTARDGCVHDANKHYGKS